MKKAKFTTGSTMRHVVVMSLSSSIGLVALFMVDLIDMYFISLLGQVELASAIGYAGSILFFTTSVCIGLSIAMGTLVSKAVGAKDFPRAGRLLVNVYGVVIILTGALAAAIWVTTPYWVELLGATGFAAEYSIDYLRIMIPSMPILGMAMTSGAVLRAVGDAKRSMTSILLGGAVNAALDPLLIFGFGLGVKGAAIASVCARFAILFGSLPVVYGKHKLPVAFEWNKFLPDLKPIFTIALPAILTNAATPIGMAYVTAAMAKFGDAAVAGMSIIGRMTPVAFAVVFAVSGAVGPIIGQNFGARNFARVSGTIWNAMLFVTIYVLGVSALLFFSPNFIAGIFGVEGDALEIIRVFCRYVAITYVLVGATFVGNAAFNNLGKPNFSTIVNVGKATLGTIPFVYFGGRWSGASGVIVGQAVGAALFGVLSLGWVSILTAKLRRRANEKPTNPAASCEKDRRSNLRNSPGLIKNNA